MLQEIRFPVYRGLGTDIPFLKGEKTIVYIETTGRCRIDWCLSEEEYNGSNVVDIFIGDRCVEVINIDLHHIFVHIKYHLHDNNNDRFKYNRYKNNILEGIYGFQFLDEDGNWYNYPY